MLHSKRDNMKAKLGRIFVRTGTGLGLVALPSFFLFAVHSLFIGGDAINGFAVDSMVRRFDKQFKDSGLTGVPAVIVNNKYLVEAGGITSLDEYFELVNFLLKK